MARIEMPINYHSEKFYQRDYDCNKFSKLSEEKVLEIAKKIYKRQEIFGKMYLNKPEAIYKIDQYYGAMEYLTGPAIHLELRTFDEKMAYLIMTTDPNLFMFKEFLKLDLLDSSEIAKVTDKQEQERLMEIKRKTIATYESVVREKLGFFDIKLLKYEEMFFKRFFGKRELITEVNSNVQNSFLNNIKSLKDFNTITETRYNELVQVAQTWLSIAPNRFNFKVAAYSITNQTNLLGLKNFEEQVALFILLVDNNLDMLRIYEEESNVKDIERRIIEEFGFYNPELLILEKKFHKKFCPNKETSIWTKIKKN